MTSRTLVYAPVAPPHNAAKQTRQGLDSLTGKVVGFIDNAKPNFNALVDDLEDLLISKYGVAAVIRRGKRGPMRAASGSVIKELADRCDVVITGAGDWGGCTSWSIHDGIAAAKEGSAALTVCSTAFLELGRAQAKALGFPDLPIAVVPHPFGTLCRDAVRRVAGLCVDEIAVLLRGSVSVQTSAPVGSSSNARAELIEVPDDADVLNRFFIERRWGDGLPVIAPRPEDINIIVAGGSGTHSVYVPVSGGSRSVTREIVALDC